jgi:hypothetical protein
MIGTKLGYHEIMAHLGTGGFGEVYQATPTPNSAALSPSSFCPRHSLAMPNAWRDSNANRACWRH